MTALGQRVASDSLSGEEIKHGQFRAIGEYVYADQADVGKPNQAQRPSETSVEYVARVIS